MIAETLNRELDFEDLVIAARLYYKERWDWGRVAKELRCDEKTLYNRRHGVTGDPEDWSNAKAHIVEEMRSEARPTAWGGLLRASRGGDTAATKELLSRTEGAVAQKTELTGTLETGPNTSSMTAEDFARYVDLQAQLAELTREAAKRDPR